MSIKVLALDDDNHTISFVTELANSYYSAAEFMKEALLKPHKIGYEVRMIALVDVDLDACPKADDYFDIVGGFKYRNDKSTKEAITEFMTAFDELWEIGEENFYV